MSQTPHLVRVRAVSWRRGGLRDLSLELAGGEFLTLLGPAGGGKSALLALLAGLARPDSGAIEMAGLADLTPAHRRSIGVVFAGENLFGHMTVAQNVALPLRARMRDVGAIRVRVAAMIDRLGLAAVADLRPAALSVVDARRAALARALVIRPRLLLLDEPLADCDPAPRVLLRADLATLQREFGLGVIMATRTAADARAVSDRIAAVIDGRIVQEGAVGELYDRPASGAVAACLGETNRLAGVLRAIEDDVAVVDLDCGARVEAGLGDARRPGERCVVTMRPERVAVAAASAAELGEGAVAAVVEAIRDMGDHVHLVLAVGHDRVTVRRSAGAAMAGFASGRSVAIAWQPHHAWAFREAAKFPAASC